DFKHIGEGGVGQRQGGGASHCPRHIGHTVVNNTSDGVDGILVSGGAAGFETAPLVDGHVHQYRTGFHQGQHVPGHQFGRCCPGDQHGPDNQVGLGDMVLDGVGGGDRKSTRLNSSHVKI